MITIMSTFIIFSLCFEGNVTWKCSCFSQYQYLYTVYAQTLNLITECSLSVLSPSQSVTISSVLFNTICYLKIQSLRWILFWCCFHKLTWEMTCWRLLEYTRTRLNHNWFSYIKGWEDRRGSHSTHMTSLPVEFTLKACPGHIILWIQF